MNRNFPFPKPKPLALAVLLLSLAFGAMAQHRYAIVDTGQQRCYGDGVEVTFPQEGQAYFGQDAEFKGNPANYRDNRDGTITDLVTGLIWQKRPDFKKRDHQKGLSYANKLVLGGKDDWRIPTIKELFSLANFEGDMNTRTPYIDTKTFDFEYPDPSKAQSGKPGNRNMDGQYASSTEYLGTTMFGDESVFGFNFADGRIKSYPKSLPKYIRCVRGTAYGKNEFKDNQDGTVTDHATGLTWMKSDSKKTYDWKGALAFADGFTYAGHDDWRLPNIKELQSLVDYSRAPDAKKKSQRAPAIDPVFVMQNPEGWDWSSTTHLENSFAYYVCFGRGLSAWIRNGAQVNAHGAGAVRSDPKSGDPAKWSKGHGPQGDEIRIFNHVRLVRGGIAVLKTTSTLKVRKTTAKRQAPGEGSGGPPSGGPGQTGPSQTGPGGDPGEMFVRRLDKDGDGKVSKQEFDGPKDHFSQFDKDGDGFITASEAPSGPPKGRGGPPRR